MAINRIVAAVLEAHGACPKGFKPVKRSESVVAGLVAKEAALQIWDAIRAQHLDTGIWPILRGDPENLPPMSRSKTREVLRRVPQGATAELLAERFEERRELLIETNADAVAVRDHIELARWADKAGVNGTPDPKLDRKLDDWPARPSKRERQFNVLDDLEGKQGGQCVLALVETAHPHEAPAHLGFGGWNDAPAPELQVAVLREWGKRFGAVPVCMSGDVLECAVDQPPRTPEEAFALAADQWIFCDDIVAQGTMTVRRLAFEIWRSPTWFFWWD